MSNIEFNWPILGQERIKKYLQKSLVNEYFTHAYLFVGPEKIGKTKTAKLIAKTLLCENYKKYQEKLAKENLKVPCGQCQYCQQFEKNIHPDVHYLERQSKESGEDLKTQISIIQVREMQKRISNKAFLNSYKIVIIPEADFLTEEASNSLLKTLEEPTQKTVVFLIAKDKKNLLTTIVSRCQALTFSVIGKNDIYEYLIGKDANRDQAKQFSQMAQGRPTRAMKLFSNAQQYSELKDEQIRFLEILGGSSIEKFSFVDEIHNEKKDVLIDKINEWSMLLRDLLFIQLDIRKEVANNHLLENLNQIEGKFSQIKLLELISKLERVKNDINKNINIKLTLENFFLKT